MCRPPDLGPSSAGLDDGFDPYVADGADDWNEGNFEAADFGALGSELGTTSVLGKRDFIDESRLAEAVSRAAKFARPAVSSAFDSAAASFVARMEQSMLQDAQRLQQKRLPGAAVEEPQQVLLQRALLEQQSKLQQLQQLQLLKQLQQQRQAEMPVLPEQQQLLLAQQQLLQQSQNKLLSALNPSAASVPQMAAFLAKQQQQQNAEAKLQALMKGGFAGAAAMMNPTANLPAPVQSKPLPAIHPKPANPTSAVAAAIAANSGADFNNAAAMFGLGPFGQNGIRNGGFVLGEEKKVKRMQSNRASAKRSRQRRQARLEELDKSTAQLHAENATMCAKLEKAQGEIHNLESKNRNLSQEVAKLRQMLGMEAAPLPQKVEASPSVTKAAVSGAGQQQSCVESGDHSSFKVADAAVNQPFVVKREMDSELAEDDFEYDDEVEDDADGWLSALPLSPQGEAKFGLLSDDCPSPGLEQMLVQGDVFSELLACFEG